LALTKDKKQSVVAELSELLGSSKMTVVSKYKGVNVKALQQLRRQGKSSGTKIKVFKNRLVKRALADNKALSGVETGELKEMLLYSFNATDEVAPAKAIAEFAKTNPALEFVGAISAEGKFLSAEEVKALASLPSREQLIAQVVATLLSPVNDVTNALSGNLHGLLDALATKAA
jgi:large subunit ribosomal protein L10